LFLTNSFVIFIFFFKPKMSLFEEGHEEAWDQNKEKKHKYFRELYWWFSLGCMMLWFGPGFVALVGSLFCGRQCALFDLAGLVFLIGAVACLVLLVGFCLLVLCFGVDNRGN